MIVWVIIILIASVWVITSIIQRREDRAPLREALAAGLRRLEPDLSPDPLIRRWEEKAAWFYLELNADERWGCDHVAKDIHIDAIRKQARSMMEHKGLKVPPEYGPKEND